MSDPDFEYHPDAMDETGEAYRWYADRDPEAADRFKQEIQHARSSIVRNPLMWPPYLHGTRRVILEDFPFSLVYSVEDTRIVGVAVAHHRRRPGYWKDRLAD